MEVPDPRTAEGRAFLDQHLLHQAFLAGPSPTQADAQVYSRLGAQAAGEEVANLARWLANMASFQPAERKAWPPPATPVTIAQSEEKEVTLRVTSNHSFDPAPSRAAKRLVSPAMTSLLSLSDV